MTSPPCSKLSEEAFCAAWPRQALADAVDEKTTVEIRDAVRQRLLPFATNGVNAKQLSDLLRSPCMQRQCIKVQVHGGEVFVEAPEGMRACRRHGSVKSKLGCPSPQQSWQSAELCSQHTQRSKVCDPESRKQQPGVTVPDWWHDDTYPHVSDWHFAAALNISDCSSAFAPIAGDHNYVFSRLRLQSMLRLLVRAARR
jgi:hypothetical protein